MTLFVENRDEFSSGNLSASVLSCSLTSAEAVIAANNGATSRQLMAIFGWETLKESERYTRGADQQRFAEGEMHLLEFTNAPVFPLLPSHCRP